MNQFLKFLSISVVITTISACGKKLEDESTAVDADEAVLEAGINSASSLADEVGGGGFAKLQSEKVQPSIWAKILVPSINASTICSRPYSQICSGQTKSIQYSGCTGAAGLVSLTGTADLVFTGTANCSFSNVNDTLTRTYNIDFSGPRGGVLNLSSDTKTDYRQLSSYGGGGRLTRTGANTWAVRVLGRHTSYTKDGVGYYSTSVRTLTDMTISGSLGRTNRVLTGGSLEVNHNLAGFTATFVPTNLTWSGSCYPSSGTIAVTYSGSKTGSATIEFTGSGTATYTKDGESKTIEISYCE